MKPSISLLLMALLAGCGGTVEEPKEAEVDQPAVVSLFDNNGDGRLSAEEIPGEAKRVMLHGLDADSDGELSAAELQTIGRGGAGRGRFLGKGQPSWDPAEEVVDGVRVVRNIDFAAGPEWSGGRGKLDLYLQPEGENHPVLVFFHGGGLTIGDKERLTPLGVRFVKLGYVVVCPNYRLAPEWYFPAYMEDAAAAFSWVWNNVATYGGDRERITVSGGSAGGHITGLLSLDGRFLEPHGLSIDRIRVSIPITGMMDAATAGAGRVAITYEGDIGMAEEASPIRHVRDDAPPMLLMVADGDTELRRNQNIRMFDAMNATGHPAVEFQVLQDRTHGSIFTHMLEEGDPTVEYMLDFMRRHGAGGE